MSDTMKLRIPFKAPLQAGDTAESTVGCRANNPYICGNNGINNVCAFASKDGICRRPSKAWKKQFMKLSAEGENDAK